MRLFLFLEPPQRPRTAEGPDKAEFRAVEARFVVGVNFASVTLSRRSGTSPFQPAGLRPAWTAPGRLPAPGSKLEEILRVIRGDFLNRCTNISDDNKPEAQQVLNNNVKILELISQCITLAEDSTHILDKAFGAGANSTCHRGFLRRTKPLNLPLASPGRQPRCPLTAGGVSPEHVLRAFQGSLVRHQPGKHAFAFSSPGHGPALDPMAAGRAVAGQRRRRHRRDLGRCPARRMAFRRPGEQVPGRIHPAGPG